jgi:hypothetical protein
VQTVKKKIKKLENRVARLELNLLLAHAMIKEVETENEALWDHITVDDDLEPLPMRPWWKVW